jgi:hypothetical protein
MASANLNLSYKQDVWDVKCSVSEISSSGNYRTISLTLGVRTKDFTGGRDGGYHVNCADGGSISERSCTVPGSSQDYFVLYDETFDVYVAPGETYADISFDFEIHFYSSSAGATRSLSGTIDKISGLSIVSGVSISSAKDIYFGDKVSITWTPPDSAFAYKLKFVLGSYTHTTGMLSPKRTTAYTYSSLTIPVSAASNIPNSVSGSMSVTITQYKNSSSSETVGSSVTKRFKVTLKDDVVPTISTYSVSLDNSSNTAVAAWDVGLVGYSKVNLSASANGIYGSTIKSFSISGDYTATVSGSSLNYIGNTISSSGNKSFTITCTDSRGRKSSAVTTDVISILPYTQPKILSLSSVKEEYGDTNSLNDRMVVTASWEYDTVDGYNSASGIAYYKESSATDWFMHSGIVENNTPFTLSELQLDDEKSYNIMVVVTDSVGNSANKSSFSSTTQVLLDFRAGGKGLGIGSICQNDGMEVFMDATFNKDVYIRPETGNPLVLSDYIRSIISSEYLLNFIYPVGSIYTSLSSTSPATLFGGTWERIQGRFLLSASSTYEANSTGGEATHKLTVNELPSHNHGNVYSSDVGSSDKVMDWISGNSGTKIGFNTVNTGGGQAHNNMPPYLAVYMWKRTA